MKTTIPLLTCALTLAGAYGADSVLTLEEQKALTPQQVLADLREGNQRFVRGEITNVKTIKEEILATSNGQYPQAIVLSCVDSRVPVELVFDQNIGDVFVARVAGNVENDDILGSMEFATKAAGAKLVLVLGHEACGAVKGACDGVEMGHLTGLLDKIRPAVERVSERFVEQDRSSASKAFVAAVVEENVRHTVQDVRDRSPILAELERSGALMIVGAIYSLRTGGVTFLEAESR